MRRLIAILLAVCLTYFGWLFFEITYNLEGYANVIFSFFWGIFASLFAGDLLKEIGLFFLVALGLFGGFSLSRRGEKRVWAIVSFVMAVLSLVELIR